MTETQRRYDPYLDNNSTAMLLETHNFTALKISTKTSIVKKTNDV